MQHPPARATHMQCIRLSARWPAKQLRANADACRLFCVLVYPSRSQAVHHRLTLVGVTQSTHERSGLWSCVCAVCVCVHARVCQEFNTAYVHARQLRTGTPIAYRHTIRVHTCSETSQLRTRTPMTYILAARRGLAQCDATIAAACRVKSEGSK